MRILDENDNELCEEDIDLDLGKLVDDRILIQHHDAVPAVPRQTHYSVGAFYFTDRSKYVPTSEQDPHIGIKDATKCLFFYVPQSGEPEKQVSGIDCVEIEDNPGSSAQDAYDEYEEIQRYILYTEEERRQREHDKEIERKKQEILDTGVDRLEALEEYRTEVNDTFQDINQNMSELGDNISANESATSTVAADLTQLESKVDSNKDGVDSSISGLNESVGQVSEGLVETNMTVEDLVLIMADLVGGSDDEA